MVQKGDTKGPVITMSEFRLPAAAELYAFEQLARRERAKAQARLVLTALRWSRETLKTIFLRPYAKRPARKAAFNA
jgi:hypothetical protein